MPVEVIMEFDEQDNPVIRVKGAPGKACKKLTADLERKLGTVTKEEHTAEYRQTETKNVARIPNRS